jgi:FMN-dependent dehydrogenase
MATESNYFSPPLVVNIHDLRRLAKKRLPRAVFDYLDGGAEDERTLQENTRAFEELIFRPRAAVAVRDCEQLAPVGYSRLMHPGGEVAAAEAAGAAGTGYILSTISGHKLENVKAASKGLLWKDERHDGKIMEAVRLVHFVACGREGNDYVELKRTDESATVLRIVWRMLPRNGGRALLLECPACGIRQHDQDCRIGACGGRSNHRPAAVRCTSGERRSECASECRRHAFLC